MPSWSMCSPIEFGVFAEHQFNLSFSIQIVVVDAVGQRQHQMRGWYEDSLIANGIKQIANLDYNPPYLPDLAPCEFLTFKCISSGILLLDTAFLYINILRPL